MTSAPYLRNNVFTLTTAALYSKNRLVINSIILLGNYFYNILRMLTKIITKQSKIQNQRQ